MLMFLPWYVLVYSQVQFIELTKAMLPRSSASVFFYHEYKESIKKAAEDARGGL
jgi:hypothetical protein